MRGVAAALCALGIQAAAPPVPAVPVTLVVSESVIRITPRYKGELVRVRGTAPAGCGVVVKLASAEETLVCSRQGKVGPFWLSVGRVRFENLPRMYKVKSSEPVDGSVDVAEQLRYGLGRRGLKGSTGERVTRDGDLYFNELILVQQRERLYDFEDGAVDREGDTYRTSFFWPPDGPPGRYRLEAYAVRNGRVVGFAGTEIDVRAVGIESWVRDLARTHGILYGLLSVALAGLTGLAASVAFKPRGGSAGTAAPTDR